MRIRARRLCKAGAGGTRMTDEHVSSDPYHIQAAPAAAAIQKLVLKHQESFIVADRAGDFPTHFEGELGFYHEGTRHLRWLELRLHGDRPLILSAAAARDEPPSVAVAARSLRAPASGLAAGSARLQTDNEAFSALFDQSLADLQMLLTDTPHGAVPYAGVPWFVAPFGRDSIITALQLLPYNAGVAAGTLRFLAALQGRAYDDFKDEAPGKILHEYRRRAMANSREL